MIIQFMQLRDPKGFRPMVLGHKESDDTYIVTSESAAVTAVGATLAKRCSSRRINQIKQNWFGDLKNYSQLILLVHIVLLNLLTLHILQVTWKDATFTFQEKILDDLWQRNSQSKMLTW